MSKPRDYSYEALAEATSTDMEGGRGELNIGLKTIKQQSPELTDYALADEIHRRARLYREVMGDEILLTPTALAKHWKRVHEESSRPARGVNLSAQEKECETCGGDRFVVVRTRPPIQTQWMREKGITPSSDSGMDEMAPCPSCSPDTDISYWRGDGTRFVAPDAARVREMMSE